MVGSVGRLAKDDHWVLIFAVDVVLVAEDLVDLLAGAFYQYRLDLGLELLGGKGLGDIGVDAGLERAQHVFFGGARGEEQDRQLLVAGGVADFFDQLDAIHNRHIPVGEHQVYFVSHQPFPPLGAVPGLDHIVETHALEHGADELAHTLGVFDQQYFHGAWFKLLTSRCGGR